MADLFDALADPQMDADPASHATHAPDLAAATKIIVAFSGGKDSAACVAHLLDLGVPKEKIELWHHDIDGREGRRFMDWPVTAAYCKAFADALGLKIYFSWKEGGFEREMLRSNAPTAPIHFEQPDGTLGTIGGNSTHLGTRRLFPQLGGLTTRWCSGYLKIDVGAAALRNQDRFLGQYTVFVTGERAEESASRAKYKMLEPHRTDQRHGRRRPRKVDHWRPILHWREAQVWDALRRHGIRPHPVYDAGFSRCSCAICIFASSNQMNVIATHAAKMLSRVASYESEFGKTIHRTKSVGVRAAEGRAFPAATAETMARCLADTFNEPILVAPTDWTLPAGAYGENAGPT